MAIVLLFGHGMNKTSPASDKTVCVVRWVLRRGDDLVTCRVDARVNATAFDVSVVSLANPATSASECLPTPRLAFQRHAEIAKRLREDGWTVATRTQ